MVYFIFTNWLVNYNQFLWIINTGFDHFHKYIEYSDCIKYVAFINWFSITNDSVTGQGEYFVIASYKGIEYEGVLHQVEVITTKKLKKT